MEAYWKGNIPWASVKDIKGDYLFSTVDTITDKGVENSATNICKEDELILVTRIEPSKTIISKIETAINQDLKIVKSELSATFLHYYFKCFRHSFEQKSSGSTVLGITIPNVQNTPFPLPPIAKQQRIVEQIESLFSKLDEAKEKAQEVIDGFDDRRIMILRNAFEGLLTEKWRKENGKSISEWERKRLSDCASAIGDGLHGTPVYSESGEYYFINGNNLEYDHIEYKSDTKTVNKAEYDKYYIELDDTTVFVSINGTLGKTAFYNNEPVILGKSACYVNTVEKLDKYYLRYFFNTKEFIDYANEKATGSTIKNLGLKAIRMLEINVPSLDEQKEIVRLLDDLLVKEREAREATEVVIANIELMKKSILAKAFRGELGTNIPMEESSMELLRQIIE